MAFSVGSFIGAPVATPLAQRYGRGILASGAVGLIAGVVGVVLAAWLSPSARRTTAA